MRRSVALLFILATAFTELFAQQDSIEKIEVVTYTRYNPVLTAARKLPTIPVFETTETELPEFEYQLPEFRYAVQPTYLPAKAISVQTNSDRVLNDNYFKVGGGNYLTGLAEVHLHNTQNKNYDFGGFARHFSSNAGNPENADFSDNQLGIFGTKTTSKGALSGKLNYERHVVHFYGFNDSLEFDKQFTNQIYNDINGLIGWQSNPGRRGWGLATDLDFYLFSTLKNNENAFKLTLNPFLEMKQKGKVDLKAMVDFNMLDIADSSFNRMFVHFDPSYSFEAKKFNFKVGVKTLYTMRGDEDKFYVFPDITAQHYIVKDKLKAFASVGGGVQKNQLRTLSYINPFLLDSVGVQRTINQLEFNAGIKGTLVKKVDYLVAVNYRNQKDLPLFLSDTGVLNRFGTVYDNVNVTAFKTGLGVRVNEEFFIQWGGTFYSYQTDKQAQAWQLPDYEIDFNIRYRLGKKLYLRAQTYVIGERFQRDARENVNKKLNAFADINAMAEYRYSDYLAFFLNVNNISNARYQKWYNYPAYGINVLGGVSFSL